MGSTPAPEEPAPAPAAPERPPRGLFPPEVVDVLMPGIKLGTLTGAVGTAFGIGAAIGLDKNPWLSGPSIGAEWFALGSTYWYTRTLVMRSWGGQENLKSSEKIMASAMAGSVGGGVVGLLRSTRSILPCVAFCSLLGGGGQVVANFTEARPPRPPNFKTWAEYRWIPLKPIPDDEYSELLGEKILTCEANIALIDDSIAKIKADDAAAKAEKTQSHGQGEPRDVDKSTK